jgi:hypothetical protein
VFVWVGGHVEGVHGAEEAWHLFAEFGDEAVEVCWGPLGLGEDGAVGLVSDPPGEVEREGDGAGGGAEADALDGAAELETTADHWRLREKRG